MVAKKKSRKLKRNTKRNAKVKQNNYGLWFSISVFILLVVVVFITVIAPRLFNANLITTLKPKGGGGGGNGDSNTNGTSPAGTDRYNDLYLGIAWIGTFMGLFLTGPFIRNPMLNLFLRIVTIAMTIPAFLYIHDDKFENSGAPPGVILITIYILFFLLRIFMPAIYYRGLDRNEEQKPLDPKDDKRVRKDKFITALGFIPAFAGSDKIAKYERHIKTGEPGYFYEVTIADKLKNMLTGKELPDAGEKIKINVQDREPIPESKSE